MPAQQQPAAAEDNIPSLCAVICHSRDLHHILGENLQLIIHHIIPKIINRTSFIQIVKIVGFN
jgi:hypothetical protein